MVSLAAGVRRSVMGVVLVAGMMLRPGGAIPAASAEKPTLLARSSYFISEVRLRKLHLVRPDLIPYPINFEVYC